MDNRTTPLTGKYRFTESKTNRKIPGPQMHNRKESSGKRVFGAPRCSNFATKPDVDKPVKKQASNVVKKFGTLSISKLPRSNSSESTSIKSELGSCDKIRATILEAEGEKSDAILEILPESSSRLSVPQPSAINSSENPATYNEIRVPMFEAEAERTDEIHDVLLEIGLSPSNSTANSQDRPCYGEKYKESSGVIEHRRRSVYNINEPSRSSIYNKIDGVQKENSVEKLKTKLRNKTPGTPYYSAEKCNNCRWDRLESSSYWLAQIKLAEAGDKHFVSAAFFRLAVESKAEPIWSLRVELRRYIARHRELSLETKWREASILYGLHNDEEATEEIHGAEHFQQWHD